MSKLEIHVGDGFAASRRRVLDAVGRAVQGDAVGQTHITFETWEALASVMSPKRFAMIRHLHRMPERSVAALARSLGRDYKRVHEDVEALVAAGLVERSDEGLSAGYDTIETRIAL